ncbi:MAG: hypothetical protein PF517_01895 [Salinivirgaceae bacterium]|jgi:hypothetical protein|nr:hypothetical protein [Salinivirgaceae bacterium]
MNTLTRLVFFSLIFTSFTLFAQFEQKLTINGSAAFVYPDLGEEYSSYGNGYGLEGGLQYNLNRKFSLYGAARFYYMFGAAQYTEAYYDNISIGGGAKLNILPNMKINPFLFGEANINFIWLEEYIYSSSSLNDEFGTSIGGLGGGGLDFILNDNFAIYIQSGMFYTYWDGRTNLYSQIGARINLIKSKTL